MEKQQVEVKHSLWLIRHWKAVTFAALVVSILGVVVGVTAQKEEKDPLYSEILQLKAQVDEVLLAPQFKPNAWIEEKEDAESSAGGSCGQALIASAVKAKRVASCSIKNAGFLTTEHYVSSKKPKKKKWGNALVESNSVPVYDVYVDDTSEPYLKLVDAVKAFKAKIEAAADARRDQQMAESEKFRIDLYSADRVQDEGDAKKLSSDALEQKIRDQNQESQIKIYGKFAEVVAEYLKIQKRLLANHARNLHHPIDLSPTAKSGLNVTDHSRVAMQNFLDAYQSHPQLYAGNAYDFLNLHLNFSVGTYLEYPPVSDNVGLSLNDTVPLKLDGNVWHHQDPKTYAIDSVEVGLTALDKSNAELAALMAESDVRSYGKLIQFLVVRERLINHWAVDRMSSTVDQEPNLKSCAPTLLSFIDHSDGKNTPVQNYYQQLWNQDRYNEFFEKQETSPFKAESFTHIETAVEKVAQGRPLVTVSQYQTLRDSFYDALLKSESAAHKAPDVVCQARRKNNLEKSQMAEDDKLRLNTHHDEKGQVILGLLDQIEGLWIEKAHSILLDANYASDSWENAAVAHRTTDYAFQFRKQLLMDALLDQASRNAVICTEAGTTDTRAATLNAAMAIEAPLVDRFLKSQKIEDQWKQSLESAILATLKQVTDSVRVAAKKERLNEKFEQLKNALDYYGNAEYITKNVIPRVWQLNKSTWLRQNKLRSGDDFERGFLSYDQYIQSPNALQAWLPGQIPLFFQKKLAFWGKQDDRKTPLATIAREIAANDSVMKGMSYFFSVIVQNASREYKKDASYQYAKNWDLLYSDQASLVTAARQSYLYFISKITDLKGQKSYTLSNALKQVGSINLAKLARSAEDDDSIAIGYIPPGAVRDRTIHLFHEALAMFNLAKVSVSYSVLRDMSTVELLHRAGSATDFKYPKLRAAGFGWTVQSFTGLEQFLNESETAMSQKVNDLMAAPGSTKISGAFVFRTLLDQQLLAEVLHDQAISENPLLAIQVDRGHGSDDPLLLDEAASHYDPKSGTVDQEIAKSEVVYGVKYAVKNYKGLAQEACDARPGVSNNEAFRNIFIASPNLRRWIVGQNKKYQSAEAKMIDITKSPYQKILDTMDSATSWMGILLVIGIAVAVLSGPAGIMGAIVSGAFSLAQYVGATEGATVGAELMEGLLTGERMGKIGAFVARMGEVTRLAVADPILGNIGHHLGQVAIQGVFFVQLYFQGYVNLIELPQQLKYEIQVSNSQVGYPTSQAQILRTDVRETSDLIHKGYWSLGTNALFQLAFTPSFIKQISTMAGFTGKSALKSFAEAEENKILVESFRPKTLQEFKLYSKTPEEAEAAYARQQLHSGFLKLGFQVPALNANVTENDIVKLMPASLANAVGGTDALMGHLTARIEKLAALTENHIQVAEYLNSQRLGESADLNLEQKFSEWFKDTAVKAVLKNKRTRLIISNKAFSELEFENFTSTTIDRDLVYKAEVDPKTGETAVLAETEAEDTADAAQNLDAVPADEKPAIKPVEKVTDKKMLRALIHITYAKDMAKEQAMLKSMIKGLKEAKAEILGKLPSISPAELDRQGMIQYFSTYTKEDWKKAKPFFEWIASSNAKLVSKDVVLTVGTKNIKIAKPTKWKNPIGQFGFTLHEMPIVSGVRANKPLLDLWANYDVLMKEAELQNAVRVKALISEMESNYTGASDDIQIDYKTRTCANCNVSSLSESEIAAVQPLPVQAFSDAQKLGLLHELKYDPNAGQSIQVANFSNLSEVKNPNLHWTDYDLWTLKDPACHQVIQVSEGLELEVASRSTEREIAMTVQARVGERFIHYGDFKVEAYNGVYSTPLIKEADVLLGKMRAADPNVRPDYLELVVSSPAVDGFSTVKASMKNGAGQEVVFDQVVESTLHPITAEHVRAAQMVSERYHLPVVIDVVSPNGYTYRAAYFKEQNITLPRIRK